MSEPIAQRVAGFFGKLPARGDFIGRHLPKSFLDPWDTWLQAAIAQSRTQLAEMWREYYCTSPIWRFALGPGSCGPVGYTGILMPSVDRVGRYYPLAITIPLEPASPLFALPLTAEPWFLQAEQLALMGLDLDSLDLDDFSRQVAALGTPDTSLETEIGSAVGNIWYYVWPESLGLASIEPTLASDLLNRSLARSSLWWTEGSERIPRCLLVCEGLPPVAGFVALLAGGWQQWGWIEKQLAGITIAPDVGESGTAEESAS